MRKLLLILTALCLTISRLNAQAKIFLKFSIPETYELSNIILALTDYGKSRPMGSSKKFNLL